MRLEPIQHMNLTERVYQTIKERIISQEIEVGARLRDEELAAQLGVSRTPVREALMYLSQEGLVEVIPRSGTRVRTFTEQDIKDIFEVRISLETLAVRKAALRLPATQVSALRRSWEEAEAALDKGNVKRALDLDREMHRVIVEGSGNRKLRELMEGITQYVALFRSLGAATTADHPGFTYGIPEILDALERRDSEKAARALEEHIEWARERTVGDFQTRNLLNESEPHPSG